MIATLPTTTLPPLRALRAPWVNNLLGQRNLLHELIAAYGSPVNIHHPATLSANVDEYREVFRRHGIDHQIFFARKANRTLGLVHEAKRNGYGVDTASYRELEQCLAAGVPADDLVVTAAVKTRELLRLAIQADVPIMLDNEDEVQLTLSVADELNRCARVGLRVSGFSYAGEKLYSRFGVDVENAFSYLAQHCTSPRGRQRLCYEGLHFHLDGYDPAQRGAALLRCLALAERLKSVQLHTKFIDMGGGLLMNYLADKAEWETFARELRAAVRGERSPITFGNNGLGYEFRDGDVHGKLKVYPYYNELARSVFLEKVLSIESEEGTTAATLTRAAGISLRIEPGRSLLDQVGITVARVAFRKEDSRGDQLVGLEMNMTQMYSSSADFLLDPEVLYQDPRDNGEPVEVYFTGAYCLERDILLKRKIALRKLPAVGDLVVFFNTAGYMMHFFESEAHLFPLANNLVIQGAAPILLFDEIRLDET